MFRIDYNQDTEEWWLSHDDFDEVFIFNTLEEATDTLLYFKESTL